MSQFKHKSKVTIWSLILLIPILAIVFALVPAAMVDAEVVSPEVGADGWVTFRFEDPTADRVQLYGEFSKNDLGAMCPSGFNWPVYDMTMDAGGVWTFTIQLDPNYYNYRFIVWHDDTSVDVTDPANPAWHPEAINSQVYVPGPDYEWVAVQDVPHGTLQEEFYFSTYTESERPYAVYLPPGYDKGKRTYPSLYLSHGASGNHIDWSTQGLAGNILDNLIAEHKIRPMVVVMTNFNDVYPVYGPDLINNIIPDVEAKFRVNKNPEQRGFGGLSMGGLLAANLLTNSPEEFGFIGIWSGGGLTVENMEPKIEEIREMRAIDFSVGKQDFLYNFWAVPSMEALDYYGIPYTSLITEGDCHTWYFWRDALYHYLTGPLFKVN